MKPIEDIFKERILNDKLNTSYPLNPSDWSKYRTSDRLQFAETEELSFYVHIPFCQNLCSFCEYTRMRCPEKDLQRHYLDVLNADIKTFINKHQYLVLRGFDIGGGTPTALNDDNFACLMDIYKSSVSSIHLAPDFEPSIEGTFQTLSEKKLQLISDSGIRRLSFGVQSTSGKVLSVGMRTGTSFAVMNHWIKYAKYLGIRKINLDLMYGLKWQKFNDLEKDIAKLVLLKPDQITLYELRTNTLGVDGYMSKDDLFRSYCLLYTGLTSIGYHARFGQNTFSINTDDFGVSSYLRCRMLDGIPYKGFGISAQSMNSQGVSYNAGKNKIDLSSYLNLEAYNEEYSYRLPKDELLSKYIAVSAYSGRLSLRRCSDILKKDCFLYYKDEIDFCIKHKLMTLEDDILYITHDGFKNYGAVFSLFYL
ncbi:MAG: radical SAM protein [Bacteroidales bacterium]|jgi:oxygen-independent coproporphyrinogen-3 oxidase|nr:radical SAM protein [Bacteroidales bacterium]